MVRELRSDGAFRLDGDVAAFGARARGRLALAGAVLAASVACAVPASAQAPGPTTETVYVQGQTAEINTGAAVIFDARAGLLQEASPIYIIEFPVAAGTTGPITLPSGYQPQHNGFPASPIPYHDHVLTSTPGGLGDYSALLRIVAMRYSATYAYSPGFSPITSAEQIGGAEASGQLDLINSGAPDPYQFWTTTVLVRPVLRDR